MLKRLSMFAACLVLMGALSLLASSLAQEKTPFHGVIDWLSLPKDFSFGLVSGVATDKDDNLYVFHRAKRPIMVFDKAGKFLLSWGDDQVKTAHGLRIDPWGNVWTTDIGNHLVIKYDPQGKVLLTLGTKDKKGATQDTFNKPADIAFTPQGDVYVADGYGNSRVVKFNKDGKYLLEWGKKGKAPGEFNLPHAVFLDAKGRIYVGDRENDRIQVFEPDGKFIAQWREGGAPFGLFLEKNSQLLVADARADRVSVLNLQGKLVGAFGMNGTAAGQFVGAHSICADSQGTIYVGEGDGHRVQKLVRK